MAEVAVAEAGEMAAEVVAEDEVVLVVAVAVVEVAEVAAEVAAEVVVAAEAAAVLRAAPKWLSKSIATKVFSSPEGKKTRW